MTDTERLTSTRDAMTAHLAGKPVQFKNTSSVWIDTPTPSFHPDCEWRPKPEAKTRPWTADDVPPLCWVRGKISMKPWLVTGIDPDGVHTMLGLTQFSELAHNFEHSTDRKTWLPCVAEVRE